MPHKDPSENRRYQREWAAKRREARKTDGTSRAYFLRTRYGLTPEEWDRAFELQGRRCAICRVTEPRSRVGWHTDHDHRTGTLRGILCENCNRGLGMYGDDITFLHQAAKYLGKHSGVLNGEADIRAAISPFESRSVRNGLSYGMSHAGYDIRLDQDLHIPPKGFCLGSSMEYFDIPIDRLAMVFDKSTRARRGLSLFNTIAEPGWRGYLTLELFNASNEAIELAAGDPIAQVIFFPLEAPTEQPYSGKYQDQPRGPQPAIQEQE